MKYYQKRVQPWLFNSRIPSIVHKLAYSNKKKLILSIQKMPDDAWDCSKKN